MTVDQRPRYSHAEWLAEGKRRYGDDAKLWRFQCPFCGHVASPGDFKALGAEPGRAPKECIGRVWNEQGKGPVGSMNGEKIQPCDWAAFGLFGTLSGGAVIQVDSDDVQIFEFAP